VERHISEPFLRRLAAIIKREQGVEIKLVQNSLGEVCAAHEWVDGNGNRTSYELVWMTSKKTDA